MSVSNISIDRFLEANSSNLLPVDMSYTKYDYERVNSNLAAAQWVGGARLEFECGKYEDSVYDTSEAYIYCEAAIKVAPAGGEGAKYLSSFSSCAAEQFLTCGLVERTEVTYGGVPMSNIEAQTFSYPYAQAVYTLINNKSINKNGNATTTGVSKVVALTAANIINGVIALERGDIENIIQDADDPFDICLDQNLQKETIIGGSRDYPFDIFILPAAFDDTIGYLKTELKSNYLYRNCLVNGKGKAKAVNLDQDPTKIRFLLKLKDGFLNNPYKKPTVPGLKISLTRSRNNFYALCGACPTDGSISNVVDGREYTITFNRTDLYIKRLYLAQDQMNVYISSPELIYDVPHFNCQVFDLGSSASVNILTNWSKTPDLMLISILPKDSLTAKFDAGVKFNSVYSSADFKRIGFTELSITGQYGRQPKEPYRFDSETSENFSSEHYRAYNDFVKCCVSKDTAPSYFTWLNNMTIYGFLLSSDEASPHHSVSLPSRNTVNINGQLYTNTADISDYSLVVCGLYRKKLMLSDFRNVVVST